MEKAQAEIGLLVGASSDVEESIVSPVVVPRVGNGPVVNTIVSAPVHNDAVVESPQKDQFPVDTHHPISLIA